MDRTELDLIDQVLPVLASLSCYTSHTDEQFLKLIQDQVPACQTEP